MTHPLRPFGLALLALGFACSGAARVDAPDEVQDAGSMPAARAPDLFTLPETALSFGVLFAEPDGTFTAKPRTLLLVNRGSADLQVERIELRAANAETSEDELALSHPMLQLPAVIPARAGQNVVPIEVAVAPTSKGAKRWEVAITSDDPDQPVRTVIVTAMATSIWPCELEFSPLDFARVRTGTQRQELLKISNISAQGDVQCVILGVSLAPWSASEFSLVNGPIGKTALEPGAFLPVPIQVSAGDFIGTVEATLEVHLLGPGVPIRLPLSAQIAAECLELLPALTLGGVQTGCGVTSRTASFLNYCKDEILITGLALQTPGVSPAPCVAPECEFKMVTSPTIPTGGLAIRYLAPPSTLGIRYEPRDLGTDRVTLAIEGSEPWGPRTWRVDVTGSGTGHTDTFTASGSSAFALTQLAITTFGPFQVEVDGEPVAPVSTSGQTVWTYDSAGGTVVFASGFVPAPGQVVAITYPVPCTP